MAQTYFGSTLRAGTDATSDTTDGGFVVLTQRVSVTTTSSTAATGSVKLPANSQIIRLSIDATTAPVVGGGSATAVNATIGTAAAGTQYLSATNVISATRTTGTFTVAQLGAMKDIGTNTTVYFTLAPNGTISTTQGVYLLTVEYAPQA